MSDIYPTMLGSATAGLIARFICHPFDTVKSRLQSGQTQFSGTLDVFRKTISQEGVAALYRGVGAVIVGGVPGVCIYMTSYETSKKWLSSIRGENQSHFLTYFTAGMIAEAACCVVFVPVDVIKERLQVQSGAGYSHNYTSPKGSLPHYKNSMDALVKIVRQEGVSGIYKGYGATLLSYGPFSALYFLLYEELKERYFQSVGVILKGNERHTTELPFHVTLGCAAFAGGTASAITNPLDMAKLRLQISRGEASDQRLPRERNLWSPKKPRSVPGQNGILPMLKLVYAQEGVRGLFRGAGARVLFHTPSTAITMAVFEECRKWWTHILSPSPNDKYTSYSKY